jgi:L-amino acid N-acyltransferase YncA
MEIRLATPGDAPAINAIYRPYVTDSSVSFELEPPTDFVVAERIGNTLRQLPWLVCAMDGAICGYAYAARHRERPAYQWSVETSVYVASGQQRRGMARTLYAKLFSLLVEYGYYTAYAGIALPNPASVALHEAFGFEPIGVYRNAGYKFGTWWDVGWWQKALRPYEDPATAPWGPSV